MKNQTVSQIKQLIYKHYHLGRYEDAVRDCENAERELCQNKNNNTELVDILYQKGMALCKLKKYYKAFECYGKVMKLVGAKDGYYKLCEKIMEQWWSLTYIISLSQITIKDKNKNVLRIPEDCVQYVGRFFAVPHTVTSHIYKRIHGEPCQKENENGNGKTKQLSTQNLTLIEKAHHRFYKLTEQTLDFVKLSSIEETLKSDQEVIEWLKKFSSPWAHNNLGVMYANGQRVKKDAGAAFSLFKMAADHGFIYAQYNLGLVYFDGSGTEKSYHKAHMWFQKAADKGLAEAQYYLGLMYANGLGGIESKNVALGWFNEAANHGITDAKYCLGLMYANGLGVEKNEDKAIALFKEASEQEELCDITQDKKDLGRQIK